MSACIIRRKSDGLYRSRCKNWFEKEKLWTPDINKARIFTQVGHAKTALRVREGIVFLDNWRNNIKAKLTYRCENCCDAKRHYCKHHLEMFKVIEKWLTKAVNNNFYWTYDVLPVEFNIGK